MQHHFRTDRFAPIVARFAADTSGAIIIIFSIVLMLLTMLTAGGIEIHRRNGAANELQIALDSAVLAGKQRQATLQAQGGISTSAANAAGILLAQSTFAAQIGNSKAFTTTPEATFQYTPSGAMMGTASPSYNLIFNKVIPSSFSVIDGRATADYGVSLPTEIALVLDTTTSMLNKDGRTDTRFTLMRNAAKKFTHQIFDSAAASGDPNLVRVSVIPWATTVNVLGAAPAAPDYTGNAPIVSIYDGGSQTEVANPNAKQGRDVIVNPSQFKPVAWRGCISGDNEDPNDYTDTAPKKKPRALAVPPAMPDKAEVQIGTPVVTTYPSCTCLAWGDDGQACWTPGRQGFHRLIEKTVPQISNAAALINPDLKKQGGPNADPACAVCTQQSCINVPFVVNDCSNSKKKYTYEPCDAWNFYGRQAAYRPQDRPNCRYIWSSCYSQNDYDASQKGAKACVADPNEPASQTAGLEWCQQYNGGNSWTSDIAIGGPNMNCPAPMLGLSGNRRQVVEYIDRLFPVPGGTHADVGLRWALRTLSPSKDWTDLFGVTKKPGEFGQTSKVMILVTDGENEQALDYPGYWGCNGSYGPDNNIYQPDCHGSPDLAELNTRMSRWCSAIRNQYQVTVYAVSINVAGSASRSTLTDCTGDSAKVFAIDAADLSAVLTGIGNKIIAMKLTQ